jgi:hypothetical protein
MAKSYSEQLAGWVKRRPSPTRRDKNVVAFLAVRDDVKEALDEGYAVKTVWAHMHESKRIEFGYDTFLNYVNRHLRPAEQQPARGATQVASMPSSVPKASTAKPAGKPPAVTPKPGASVPGQPAGFTFNAAPNKEELL